MQERAEEFIKDLEEEKQNDRAKFEEIVDQFDKEKRGFITEINDLLRGIGEKEIEYSKSIQEFMMDGKKVESELEQERSKNKKLEQINDNLLK